MRAWSPLALLLAVLLCANVDGAFFGGPKPELNVCNGKTCTANNGKKVAATARSCGFAVKAVPCLGGCSRGTYVTGPGMSKTMVRVGDEKFKLTELKNKLG